MKTCLVIGAQGFIGQNLVRHLQSRGIAVESATSSTSVGALGGRSFDAVFFCAGNSRTYLAEHDPIGALRQDVLVLHEYLRTLTFGTWLHVSSSVVYPGESSRKVESAPLGVHEVSLYGAHKLLAERYVRQLATRWVILRPTGFFGPGVKKNLLYDVRNGRRDVYVKRASWLDYLPIDTFCDIARALAERAENEIINVGSGHCLSVEEILAMRPNSYVFHEERLVDDRSLSLERLRRHYAESPSRPDLERAIRAWVLAGPADPRVVTESMTVDSSGHGR